MRHEHEPQTDSLDEAAIREWQAKQDSSKAHYYRADNPDTRHTCECGVRTRLPVCDRCRQRKARAERKERP